MKKIFYISFIFATLLFSAGCKKDFLSELAVNPNQPSQVPAPLILPPILTGYANYVYFSAATIGNWMGYYIVSGGYATTENGNTYYVNSAGPSNWDGLYAIIKNAAYIEQNSAGDPLGAYSVASAKILKCYGFQMLVDAYGDVPYSEAFEGSGNFFPKYDDGQSVYDSCIQQLNVAISLIQNADVNSTNLGNNDIMFNGDMDQWMRFANTLKLRFIIRQSNKISASAAQSEISSTASAGYLESDATVNPGYLNSGGKQNPYWASYGVDPGGSLVSDGYNYLRAGGAAVEYFTSHNDPRLFYIYAPNGSAPNTSDYFDVDANFSNYDAAYYGDRTTASALGNGGSAGIGHGVMSGFDAPVPLMLAAESYFLQAEAVERGWMSGDAATLYNMGITASFEYLYTQGGDSQSAADAAAMTYYNQASIMYSSATGIKQIITQKWADLAGINSFEAWSEYRRTGFPDMSVLPLSKYVPLTRHIPTKLMYPNSEANTNAENYNAAVAKGNDPQNTKVFWMP